VIVNEKGVVDMLGTVKIVFYDGTISVVRNVRNMEHKYDEIRLYDQNGHLLSKVDNNEVKHVFPTEE
jgi:hypothetical protein